MANVFERFGILNASEVRLFNKSTDKILLKFIQANEMSLEVKADSKSANEQGAKAITWNLAKEGTLKLTTETTSFAQLAESLGSEDGLVLNTSPENYDRSETATVTTAGSVTIVLEHTPLANSVVSFNSLTTDGELLKELTGVGSGKNYTITDASLKVGDIVEINYIESVVAGGVYTFKIASQNSGTARRLSANVLCTNRNGKGLVVMQLNIPNVLMEQSLTITCSASDPSKFELSMTVMADGQKTDDEGNPLFFEFRSLSDVVSTVVSITDLNLTALTDSISTTFSAVGNSATNVKLQYKLSADSVYTDAVNVLDATSTSGIITGLVASSNYNVRLTYTISGVVYYSNIATTTTP